MLITRRQVPRNPKTPMTDRFDSPVYCCRFGCPASTCCRDSVACPASPCAEAVSSSYSLLGSKAQDELVEIAKQSKSSPSQLFSKLS